MIYFLFMTPSKVVHYLCLFFKLLSGSLHWSSPVLFQSPFAKPCKLPGEVLGLLLSINLEGVSPATSEHIFSQVCTGRRLVFISFGLFRNVNFHNDSSVHFPPEIMTWCYVLHVAFQEGDKRQLRETSIHPPSSERYVHTFRDLSNFSGTINVTYRYLAGTPLSRKSKFSICLKRNLHGKFQ